MNILIVEDDFSFAVTIEMLVEKLGYNLLKTIDNGKEALEFLASERPDLMLVDIDLNGDLSGIDIAKEVEKLQIPVIFMTTFNDEKTYEKAMLANPYSYMVKPFDEISLRSQIERVFREVQSNNENEYFHDCFFVKVNSMLVKVKYADVQWIASEGNYADIFLKEKRYTAKISLAKLEKQLKSDSLIRVHKRFIVNVKNVEGVTHHDILINGTPIPIGRTFKEGFLKRMNKI